MDVIFPYILIHKNMVQICGCFKEYVAETALDWSVWKLITNHWLPSSVSTILTKVLSSLKKASFPLLSGSFYAF